MNASLLIQLDDSSFMTAALAIVPGKTDAEKASEFKERIVEALKPVMEILDEAFKDDLTISYSIGPNALGKATIMQLSISKTFR